VSALANADRRAISSEIFSEETNSELGDVVCYSDVEEHSSLLRYEAM